MSISSNWFSRSTRAHNCAKGWSVRRSASSVVGVSLALIFVAAIWAGLVQPATPAGLSTASIEGLRGALGPSGQAQSILPGAFSSAALITQIPAIPSHPFRTALVLIHLAGLTVGMGAALFLDLFLLTRLYARSIENHTAELIRFGSHIVTAGLVLLWVSGLGLLAFYFVEAPFALENPKLIAKVAAVCVLTLNGMVLHNVVLPAVDKQLGRPLLAGLSLRSAFLPLAAGAVSAVSWAFCCVLGAVKELNGVVPAFHLLACYLTVLVLAVFAACVMHLLAVREPAASAAGFSAY